MLQNHPKITVVSVSQRASSSSTIKIMSNSVFGASHKMASVTNVEFLIYTKLDQKILEQLFCDLGRQVWSTSAAVLQVLDVSLFQHN